MPVVIIGAGGVDCLTRGSLTNKAGEKIMFEGIDRVAIAVNDFDEAMERFSNLFNNTFHELRPSPEMGIRACYGSS